jgi:hypothetical protein
MGTLEQILQEAGYTQTKRKISGPKFNSVQTMRFVARQRAREWPAQIGRLLLINYAVYSRPPSPFGVAQRVDMVLERS